MNQFCFTALVLLLVTGFFSDKNVVPSRNERSALLALQTIVLDNDENAVRLSAASSVEGLSLEESSSLFYVDGEARSTFGRRIGPKIMKASPSMVTVGHLKQERVAARADKEMGVTTEVRPAEGVGAYRSQERIERLELLKRRRPSTQFLESVKVFSRRVGKRKRCRG